MNTVKLNHDTEEQEEPTALILHEPVEGTPFIAVTTEGVTFLAMGRYKITPPLGSIEECMEYLDENKWTTIINILAIVVEKVGEDNENEPANK